MLELIQNNPLASLIIILVPCIGVAWKIFESIYLKPREFRISVLERNIEDLRKELERSQKAPLVTLVDPNPRDAQLNITQDYPRVDSNHEIIAHRASLLNDFSAFYKSWKDKSLTDLQRDRFEKEYLSQKIHWRLKFNDVSEGNDGFLWASFSSENPNDFLFHAIIVFESKFKEALLMINKGELAIVIGTIENFSMSPIIKGSTITKCS